MWSKKQDHTDLTTVSAKRKEALSGLGCYIVSITEGANRDKIYCWVSRSGIMPVGSFCYWGCLWGFCCITYKEDNKGLAKSLEWISGLPHINSLVGLISVGLQGKNHRRVSVTNVRTALIDAPCQSNGSLQRGCASIFCLNWKLMIKNPFCNKKKKIL